MGVTDVDGTVEDDVSVSEEVGVGVSWAARTAFSMSQESSELKHGTP